MIAESRAVPGIDGRLVEAAATGETLELILVVRGTVRPAGKRRWRVRLERGGVLTFDADWVVATTSVRRGR